MDYPILNETEVREAKFKLYDQADEIGEKFAPIFEANDWHWSVSGDWRIPTKEDISLTVCVLVKDLYHGKQTSEVSTGRIQLRLTKWRFGTNISIRVELVADTFLVH